MDLEDYRDLRNDADPRRRRGLFVVEGRLLVERLLTASRFRARSVLVTPSVLAALGHLLPRDGVQTYVDDPARIREIVGFKFHRGALGLGERGDELAIDAIVSPPGPRTLIVLENVVDQENVGGVRLRKNLPSAEYMSM